MKRYLQIATLTIITGLTLPAFANGQFYINNNTQTSLNITGHGIYESDFYAHEIKNPSSNNAVSLLVGETVYAYAHYYGLYYTQPNKWMTKWIGAFSISSSNGECHFYYESRASGDFGELYLQGVDGDLFCEVTRKSSDTFDISVVQPNSQRD